MGGRWVWGISCERGRGGYGDSVRDSVEHCVMHGAISALAA